MNQNTKKKTSWESPKRGFIQKELEQALAKGGFKEGSLQGNELGPLEFGISLFLSIWFFKYYNSSMFLIDVVTTRTRGITGK